MDITLRTYQEEDASYILDIINYNILHSTALYDYTPRDLATQKNIFKEKSEKGFPILVAVNEENVIGFGYYSEFRFREAYKFTVEHSVYVHHDYHGKGIGRLLLTELIALAKAQKMHTMIGVVDSENQGSIGFHEKFGFEIVGKIKDSGFKFNRWLHSVFLQLLLE